MKQALVITLGRVRRLDESGGHGSYRTMAYRFSEMEVSEPTSFFGLALYRHLMNQHKEIDRIVVLGTRGSMWDALLEIDDNALLNDAANERLFDSLVNQAQAENVDDNLLADLSDALTHHFSVPVQCRAIPYGQSSDEQIDILRCFRGVTEGMDSVILDVTHGLRHLPMMALVSAFLLGNDRHPVQTKGVYYGAAELRQGEVAPVVKLDGLLSLQEWVEAMAVQKASGNVSRLAEIPGLDQNLAEALRKYQFFEQMNNVTQARRCAQEIRDHLHCLPPEGLFFRDELNRMFDWVDGGKLPIRQCRQARNAFENGDYMRAVVLLTEAVISAWVKPGSGDILNYNVREVAKGELDRQGNQNWKLLRNLRNTLAHGGQAEGKLAGVIQRMRTEEGFFRAQLEILFNWAECIVEGEKM